MIELHAWDMKHADDFELFYENQNVTKIARKCCVSENPNEIANGWIEIIVFSGEEELTKMENGKVEIVSIKLYGLTHWHNSYDKDSELSNSQYIDFRNKNEHNT